MKITAQEEYGLRCMIQLARADPDYPLNLEEIARGEGISEAYVAKLMSRLIKKGLVTSLRGRKGGYALTRAASQIRVKDVFEVMGQPFFEPASYCQNHGGLLDMCAHIGDCSLRSLLRSINSVIVLILANTRLSDLAFCDERGMDKTLHLFQGIHPAASLQATGERVTSA